jgi:hypothetical protein
MMPKKSIVCKMNEACPVAKTLTGAVAVIVLVLGFYIPWLNSEVGKVSENGAKLDMIIMMISQDIVEMCSAESEE